MLPLWQAANGIRQLLLKGTPFDTVGRIIAAGQQGINAITTVVVFEHFFIAEQSASSAVAQDCVIVVGTQSQTLSHVTVFRIAAGFTFYLLDRFTDPAAVAMHRTWCPIAPTNFIQHGTPNTDASIGFKAGAFVAIVFTRCFQQANHASLDQVIDLHRIR